MELALSAGPSLRLSPCIKKGYYIPIKNSTNCELGLQSRTCPSGVQKMRNYSLFIVATCVFLAITSAVATMDHEEFEMTNPSRCQVVWFDL